MENKKRLIDANLFVGSIDFVQKHLVVGSIDFVQKHLVVGDSLFLQGYEAGLRGAVNAINEIPTVDAVEVVRCKDCKYEKTCSILWESKEPKENGYCSLGERKDDGTA